MWCDIVDGVFIKASISIFREGEGEVDVGVTFIRYFEVFVCLSVAKVVVR